MWSVEVKTIPVVIGALGLINRGLESFLKKFNCRKLPSLAQHILSEKHL
jgi:hypothetical protein